MCNEERVAQECSIKLKILRTKVGNVGCKGNSSCFQRVRDRFISERLV